MPNDDLQYLATYSTRTEAEMVRGLIEANGIKCFLRITNVGGALAGGFGMNNAPMEIWVSAKNLEAARDLIIEVK